MSEHHTPIVPHVLAIADQRHPWRLGEIARLRTIYHTPTTVRVEIAEAPGGKIATDSKQQYQVWCLPDEAAWERVQAERAAFQAVIDALATEVRRLGRYADRLAEAGGAARAPNPLTPTVIHAPDPDVTPKNWSTTRPLPQIVRRAAISHTAKLLRCRGYHPETEVPHHQRDHFVCPTDADWERVLALHRGAQGAEKKWNDLLHELGTYFSALADERYRDVAARAAVAAAGAQIDRILALAAEQATPAPHPPTWPTLAPPLFYGRHRNAGAGGIVHAWRPAPTKRSKQRHEAICTIVQTEAPRMPDWSAHPRLCGDCRRKLTAEPQEQPPSKLEEIMAGPTDAFHNLPPKLAGWRWQQNGTTDEWHLVAPDKSWRTKDYTYSNKAISEALRRVNSEPKPKPEPDAVTPPATTAPQIVTLSTMAIRTDGGTQSRAELNEETVNEYAEAMQAGSRFPPVVVYYDGETYWLADGFHRVAAARQLGQMVEAEVRQGTRRDAVLEACGANANHGLRRTNADKRRAVETLLRDEEWRQWSDREIARRSGVHHELVGRVRTELGLTGGIRQSSDGRTMDVSGIGRANAARAEQAAPPVPLTPEARDADGPWFWASKSAAHPTAHHWRARPTERGSYVSACSLEVAEPPTTGANAGHCSVCETNAARRETIPIPLPAGAASAPDDGPKTDAGRVGAIRRYLEQQRQAGRLGDPAIFDAACDMASAVYDGETWRAMIQEIKDAVGTVVQAREVTIATSAAAPAQPPSAEQEQPSDAEFHAMQDRWRAIGYTSFYRSDKGYTVYKQDRGASHYPDWAAVEAAIQRKEAEHAAHVADRLRADRQRLQLARTHIAMADQSTLPAQIRQQISDARRLLYLVSNDQAEERTALETEAVRILAELDGREQPQVVEAPVQRPPTPVRPARPKSGDVSEVLAYLQKLETYATELEQLLKVAEPEPIRAVVDDRATFEALLVDLEQMVEGGDLSAEQLASGTRALEQLDDRYNELLSELSHQEAQAYSDRMDRLQVAFESTEQQEASV